MSVLSEVELKVVRSLSLAAILTSCSPPVGAPDAGVDLPPRWPAAAVVTGRVVDLDGAGIAAASVNSTLYLVASGILRADSTCVGSFARADTVSTDASGYFRKRIEAGAPQFWGCVVLQAVPPDGSEWTSAEAGGLTVYFRSSQPGVVLDSVNASITLPSR